MKNKKISVIVPVYKVEKFLNRCLSSVLCQSFSDFEIIIIDDGSPDNCPMLCDEYLYKDSRIIVIHQKNRGLAGARDTGIKQSFGEWLLFVDSDDFIHIQTVEFLYRALLENKTNISVCGRCRELFFDNTFFEKRVYHSREINISETSLIEMFHCKNSNISDIYWLVYPKLVKKSIIQKHPFTEGRIFEDNALNFKWLIEAGKISVVDENLYFYTDNPEGIMRSKFSKKTLDYLWALEQQIEYYHKIGYNSILKLVIEEYAKNAVHFGKQIIKELHDELECRILMIETEKNLKKYSDYCEFDLDVHTKNFIMKYVHPLKFKIYKKIKNIRTHFN